MWTPENSRSRGGRGGVDQLVHTHYSEEHIQIQYITNQGHTTIRPAYGYTRGLFFGLKWTLSSDDWRPSKQTKLKPRYLRLGTLTGLASVFS